MATKLFVGGLSWGTTDEALRDAFTAFGTVTDAKIITDRDTGKSRGFGFVTFATDDEANAAIDGMDRQELDGRTINVAIALERPRGGGGGGRGGSRPPRRGGGDY